MKYVITGAEVRGESESVDPDELAPRDGDAIEVRPVEGCWWVYHE